MRRKVGKLPHHDGLAEASRRQMARYFGKPAVTPGIPPELTQRQREVSRAQFEETRRLIAEQQKKTGRR